MATTQFKSLEDTLQDSLKKTIEEHLNKEANRIVDDLKKQLKERFDNAVKETVASAVIGVFKTVNMHTFGDTLTITVNDKREGK